MGATLSTQRDSKCEEDEEQHSGQEEVQETSPEDKKNGQISSQNGKPENQTDEMNSQSEERDFADVGSGFVTLKEDASDTTDSIQEDVSQTSTDSMSKQTNNTDDLKAKQENEANNKLNDTEIGFKKTFRFGGFKFTLKKDKVEKIDEPVKIEQDKNAVCPSEDSLDTIKVNPVSTNKHDAEEIKNERIGGDTSAESSEKHNKMAVGKISELTEQREKATPVKGLMEDVPQSPEPEETMSPVKRFFSQGLLAILRKKRKEEETPKEKEKELKSLDKVVEKETTKEDTTCTCLDVSNGTFDKDIQLYKKDEHRSAAEGDIMNFLEQDKVQASPFKRLFRKLSTRRQSETKPDDTNLPEPGENISENPQLSTELIKSQKEQESKVVETQPADEMMELSHEESKKKSDSTVSWENLICVRSAKTRARKTSDSEHETQNKGEVPRKTTESSLESSTEGDHLTSSNEQSGSPAEEDSGSTWKSFKKLVTLKRISRTEETGSVEQMQSDTEIAKDESSCSLRKLISGRKKTKPEWQQENVSSDDSKATGTDIEDDETPEVVPLSECERAEPEILNMMTDGTIESTKEKEMQPIIEEDKPKQIQPLYNVEPICFDTGPSGVLVPTECMEELTEFLSKHQQLSDIPEEGIIEESLATPLSFVEWTTQDDTLADDTVDKTADAVTAPEHASEHNEDETTEMVSAVSQLSESPKTSGNVTPISPVYDMRESDTIFQDVVESICMVPSVLAFTTKDKVPDARALSVSQFIVESTTTTETKVLVAHKKEEATSICIGIVSQEIRAPDIVLPVPLIEGISEITHSVPTEFVCENLAEESKAVGIAIDNVYEAEIEEIKTMLHEVLLLDEQSTVLAETARKSKQQSIMVENIQEEVSPLLQKEDVEDDSTEVLNGIHEFIPVHAAVHSGTQLLEEQIITANMNRPETEGPLQPALEESVYVHLTQNTKKPVEVERECRIPDVESSAADVEQLTVIAEAGPVAHEVVESLPENSLNGVCSTQTEVFQVTEIANSVMHSVVASESDPAVNQASEILEDMAGVLVSDVKSLETLAPISSVIPMSGSIQIERDLENEVQVKNDPSPHFADSHTVQVKMNNTELETAKKNAETVLALSGEEEKAKQKIEPASAEATEEIIDENIVYNIEPGSREEESAKTEAIKRPCVDDESDNHLADEQEHNETAKPEVNLEITTEQETVETVKPLHEVKLRLDLDEPQTEILLSKPEESQAVESSHESYEENNQGTGTAETTETISSVRYEEKIGVECKISDQSAETGLCFKGVAGVPVSTVEYATEILPTDKGESQEGVLIAETEVSEHVMEIIKASTNQVSVEGQRVVTSELVAESPTETENKTEPEVLTQVINELKVEPLEVSESKADIIVVPEIQAETPVVASLVTELEVEIPVVTSAEKFVNTEALALTSVINTFQSDLKPVNEPEISTGTTLRETPTEVSGIQTATELSLVQTAAISPILEQVSEKEDANVNRPVILEVTEPKLEMLMVTEAISHTSAVPAQEVQSIKASALETETLVRTCVEKKVEAQGSVVTSRKEDTDMGSLVLTTTVNEGQIKTVIPVVEMLTATDIPAIQKPTDGQLVQEPEVSMVAQEIKETKLEAPDAPDVSALKIHVAKETRVEALGVAEQIIEEAVRTSVKEDMRSSIFTLIAEDPAVPSCIKLPTSSMTPVVQTPAVVPAKDQRPTVVPVVETLAVHSAVKEVEEQTGVECKISDQPVETGLRFKGVAEVPANTMEYVSEILPTDKAESQEGLLISETEVSEHVMEIIKASTNQVSVEGQSVVTSELVAESPTETENKTEPEVLTQVINELKVEPLEVSESKADIIVVPEIQAETPVVASLVTELEAETPVVTSAEKFVNTETLALTSVINKLQSDLKPVNEPEISTGTTLRETPTEVSGIQTATELSLVQTAAISPILEQVSEKEDANVNRPVILEVTEPKLEMLMVTEAISHTSAVPAQEVQSIKVSALETETLVRTCVEKKVEAQGSVVHEMSVESEVSMVAQEIKETKLETPDVADTNALKIPVAKETRVEAPGVTKQIIKEAVLTSVKEDTGSSVFTLIAEDPAVPSSIKVPTASMAPVVQTPTVVPTKDQRPTAVHVGETLAVHSAVKEVEMPFTGLEVEEQHSDAQVAVNIEVKQPSMTETEVKVTEIIEQVTASAEKPVNPEEDSKSTEERSGTLKEVSIPIVKIIKSIPGANDVREDAVDNISDDQCSRTKASGGLQDTTICHGNK
ncbi:A-kinase anchor protein 12 [Neoarius graeffei]|uniref:A-kinase anchor protein 12 n=1 Tax=Neoarius graeffei TaxID=443677 RepID=UPI00298CFA94|nr:A-kinase anchor protein 12 [Neoarius graeffei]XP_060790442.1 A-kinase anchor protein 12 [Neoarius graeffei]